MEMKDGRFFILKYGSAEGGGYVFLRTQRRGAACAAFDNIEMTDTEAGGERAR